jgi:RNA polymerase sigma-70 factor (ECF subfamily)
MAFKETPNLDTTNQSPEYLLEEEFKIKLQMRSLL